VLLEGQSDDESIRPRAALHQARGEYALALDLLHHAAQKADPSSSSCLPLLSQPVDAQLACGEDPEPTIDLMAACAKAHPSPYANALVALARGRAGQGDPTAWLRDAVDGLTHAQLPLEASLCRLDLARACSETNPEVAIAQARRALHSFELLEARGGADRSRRRAPSASVPSRPHLLCP
jgi:hypothetical protein